MVNWLNEILSADAYIYYSAEICKSVRTKEKGQRGVER